MEFFTLKISIMAKVTINTDQSKNYYHLSQAVEDCGLTQVDRNIFTKNGTGERFKFVSADHYNSTVYSVTLKPADE